MKGVMQKVQRFGGAMFTPGTVVLICGNHGWIIDFVHEPVDFRSTRGRRGNLV